MLVLQQPVHSFPRVGFEKVPFIEQIIKICTKRGQNTEIFPFPPHFSR